MRRRQAKLRQWADSGATDLKPSMSAPVDTTTATSLTMAELDAIGESNGRSALRVTTDDVALPRKVRTTARSIARAIPRRFPACDQRYATMR